MAQIFGYARVSTREQNEARQLLALREFGVEESEFLARVDKIAANAVADACTGSNPRAITPETMAKLLTCTFYGTEVDF